MRPLLDDLSFIDDIDAMRGPNRTQPMRNDKNGTPMTNLRHVPLDHRFGFVVQCNQDIRIRLIVGPTLHSPLLSMRFVFSRLIHGTS